VYGEIEKEQRYQRNKNSCTVEKHFWFEGRKREKNKKKLMITISRTARPSANVNDKRLAAPGRNVLPPSPTARKFETIGGELTQPDIVGLPSAEVPNNQQSIGNWNKF